MGWISVLMESTSKAQHRACWGEILAHSPHYILHVAFLVFAVSSNLHAWLFRGHEQLQQKGEDT